MSKAAIKTNNDKQLFKHKVQLRLESLEAINKRNISVLEMFGGEGVLWREVKKATPKKIKILSIDKTHYKNRIQLQGDNMKFTGSLDPNNFDIVDCDAWGSPYNQIDWLIKEKYKGIVHCTFIQTMYGGMSKKMLIRLGYSEKMINKIPSLFNRKGSEKFKYFLANNGVKKIRIFEHNKKNYMWFKFA